MQNDLAPTDDSGQTHCCNAETILCNKNYLQLVENCCDYFEQVNELKGI